jgi:hypothetical protein
MAAFCDHGNGTSSVMEQHTGDFSLVSDYQLLNQGSAAQ